MKEVSAVVSLERLSTFLTLSECGSYTLAAKKLFCSQPTISHHIQQLEEQYGASLILRDGKAIRLTEQGRIVQEHAARIVALVQESERRVKQSMLRQQHILSVYVSNYISEYFFSDILQQYYSERSEHMLEIHSYCYNDLRRFLLEGRTNYAIMPNYVHDEQLHKQFRTVPLFEEPLVLVVSKSHPWHDRKLLYARDLNRQTILMAQSDFLREQIQEHLLEIRSRNQFLQMSNFSIIKKSIMSGYGIAFLPYEAVKREIERGELVMLKVSGMSISRENSIFIRSDAELDKRETSFIEQVRQYFRQLQRQEAFFA